MKSSASVVTIFFIIVLATMTDRAMGMPPAQCNPGLLDEVPPRIRKVCMALSTIYELGSAMENYIDDKAKLAAPGQWGETSGRRSRVSPLRKTALGPTSTTSQIFVLLAAPTPLYRMAF